MGCKKITYQNFTFLEVIHRKNATDLQKNGLNGDHLGNIRLSYSDADGNGSIDASTEIISEKNYYPFGGLHKGYNNVVSANSNSVAQKFGFGGNEHQDELGLGWIDITARNYDAALGRWMNIDALAEKYESHSPYAYVGNSPIIRTDPFGLDWYVDADGNYHFNPELNKDNADELLKDGERLHNTGFYFFKKKGGGTDIRYLNNNGTITDKDGNIAADAGETITVGENDTSITAYDDRPSVYEYKNGEEITSNDGHNYILHDNQWLKVETPEEYKERIAKRPKTNRRPPLPRTSREIMQYDGKLANWAGVKGASGLGSVTGATGKVLKKPGKRYTPIGVFLGYIGGQVKAYKAMLKRMEAHDKTVDYHRNKKKQ